MTEKSKAQFRIAALLILVLAALVLSVAVFAWGWKYAPSYQAMPQHVQTATPADLGELTVRVQNLESIHEQNLKSFQWQLDQKLLFITWMALLVSSTAAFIGVKTFNDLDKVVKEKVNASLDKVLYHLDPTNLRIWIISYDENITLKGDAILDENGKQKRDKDNQLLFEKIETNVLTEMEKVEKRLKSTGLLNIEKIKNADKTCFDGVTIIPIFNKSMEDDFRDFLDRNPNLESSRAAFVLYTRDYFVSQSKTLEKYENLATANMPPTVASMVLTVGRGLSNASPKLKEVSK